MRRFFMHQFLAVGFLIGLFGLADPPAAYGQRGGGGGGRGGGGHMPGGHMPNIGRIPGAGHLPGAGQGLPNLSRIAPGGGNKGYTLPRNFRPVVKNSREFAPRNRAMYSNTTNSVDWKAVTRGGGSNVDLKSVGRGGEGGGGYSYVPKAPPR